MTTVTLKLPRPHTAQQFILDGNARYKVINWGRRAGKTEVFNHILGLGHGKHKAALHGLPVAYWSLTYKNVSELWGRLKSTYTAVTESKNENTNTLNLLGGGSIECWTLEKAVASRGRAYAGIIIDEAAFAPKLLDTWLYVIQPMLLDYAGWAVFGSTPNGLNDFYTLYQWGQDERKADWESMQASTYTNPHISASELDNIRDSVPDRVWKQEYLAEFLEDGGAVFSNVQACVVESPPEAHGNVVFGVDLGRHNDYTVITAMDQNGHMLDVQRFTETLWSVQEARLKAMAAKWKPVSIVIEENFNDKFAEDMHTAGLPVRFFRTTANTKQEIINRLALAFEQRDIHILNNPDLLHELRVYTVERLPSGNLRYGAAVGFHDDMVMSLALAWHGAIQREAEVIVARYA